MHSDSSRKGSRDPACALAVDEISGRPLRSDEGAGTNSQAGARGTSALSRMLLA
jgi:hypothetical protein